MPGFRDAHTYPMTPDLGKAKALAHRVRRTAILYTCSALPCDEQAQIVKNDLTAIGIHVNVKAFSWFAEARRLARRGEPLDLATGGWVADCPDPSAMLAPLLNNSSVLPTFRDPTYQRRLAKTDKLTGPYRYVAYGKFAADLARKAAPLVAFGNASTHDFFSARIGCQVYGVYGLDLAVSASRTPSTRRLARQRPARRVATRADRRTSA
jgi:ABC-type transport system substrate-binding protein